MEILIFFLKNVDIHSVMGHSGIKTEGDIVGI